MTQLHQREDRGTQMFGLLLLNRYLFSRFFWRDDLKLSPSPKQKRMLADTSRKRLLCTGRKVAKTVSLESYVIQAAVTKTGRGVEENMIVTPRQKHMDPLRDRIATRLSLTPFFDLLRPEINKTSGYFRFTNGCTWYMRIEGDSTTGENMVGLRAKRIVGDEMAFGLASSHNARQQTALPDCEWILAGVPNGVRGTPFYNLDQTKDGADWSVHHMTTYDNPLYQTPGAKEELIHQYGGENTQDYITQVLGEWGSEAMSSFPRIGMDRAAPFVFMEFTDTQIDAAIEGRGPILDILLRPVLSLRTNADDWVGGMDIGFSPDPTELSLFYREGMVWREGIRIRLLRVITYRQADVVHAVNRLLGLKLRKLAIDYQGLGRSVGDGLLKQDHIRKGCDYNDIIINANFGGRVETGADETGKSITVPVKQYSTDRLKEALARGYMLGGTR